MDDTTLLEELKARYFPPPVAPGDMTLAMLVNQFQISYRTAHKIIAAELAAGRIEEYQARGDDGKTITAYRRKII